LVAAEPPVVLVIEEPPAGVLVLLDILPTGELEEVEYIKALFLVVLVEAEALPLEFREHRGDLMVVHKAILEEVVVVVHLVMLVVEVEVAQELPEPLLVVGGRELVEVEYYPP
jgi:hypothetical protein